MKNAYKFLLSMVTFGAAHGCKGAEGRHKKTPLPKACSTYLFVYKLGVLNILNTENQTRKINKIHKDFVLYQVFMYNTANCSNIPNIYYSQRELKYFGLEILVIYEVLKHIF